MPPTRVSALLLAAGKGSRGLGFKPLRPWHGETFIAKVYRSLVECGQLSEILIVVGFEAARLEPFIAQTNANAVVNPDFPSGMHSSIRAGLLGLREPWDGVLIAHVDQPQLEGSDYGRIVEAFGGGDGLLVRPAFAGSLGNPAVIARKFLAEILREPPSDRGCGYLFTRHPDEVRVVQMDDDRCLRDHDE